MQESKDEVGEFSDSNPGRLEVKKIHIHCVSGPAGWRVAVRHDLLPVGTWF
jgi:hypothetical protein